MTRLVWYTIKFSLVGIRENELRNAVENFQKLFETFPHYKHVRTALDGETLLVKLDTEDLSDLQLEDVGKRATEDVLEALPAVLISPSRVAVHVLDVNISSGK